MIWIITIITFCIGLLVPANTIDDKVGSLAITFFGLLSASILPAMSLLVANTLSPKNSIRALNELHSRTTILIQKLWQTLGFLVASGVGVMIVVVGVPNLPETIGEHAIPDFLRDGPNRVLQAIILVGFVVGLDRLRVVGAAFQSVYAERFDLARKDSLKVTKTNAANASDMSTVFARPENFGEEVKVEAMVEGADG